MSMIDEVLEAHCIPCVNNVRKVVPHYNTFKWLVPVHMRKGNTTVLQGSEPSVIILPMRLKGGKRSLTSSGTS